MWCLSKPEGGGSSSGGERGGGLCSSMFRFPRVEGNPAVAWRVAPRMKRFPRPPIQEGRHRSSTAEGGGGVGVSASLGGRVASPASTVSLSLSPV